MANLGLFASRTPDRNARYDAVVTPHLNAAYNLARWLTRSEDDAEDVVQEACVRAFKYCHDFQGEDGRAWVLTIVRNTCYTWLRQNRQHEFTTSFDLEQHDVADESCTPETALLRDLDIQMVRREMQNLPLDFREILVLREMNGLSYKEIGCIMELPIGTVMSRLARARRRLQTQLAVHLDPTNNNEKGGK